MLGKERNQTVKNISSHYAQPSRGRLGMSLWKLRVSMLGTLAVIIGISTLFFAAILSLAGISFMILPFIIVLFNLVQWLIAPYIIDAMYRVKEASRTENPGLYGMVERLSRKSGIEIPRIMISHVPIPNAFAYSSPIAGSRVAVTTELMKTLEAEEVEAVIGHELGHLKHRDVQVMMFVSILPAMFFYIGYSMLLSSYYRGREDRGGGAAIIGAASMLLYWILTMFTLYLSRLREYYADRHSAAVIDEGPRKLSEALAKIQRSTGRMKRIRRDASGFSSLKALFIADPDHAEADAVALAQARAPVTDQRLVEEVLRREVTTLDRIAEIFSTHPNIVKRLRALQELA